MEYFLFEFLFLVISVVGSIEYQEESSINQEDYDYILNIEYRSANNTNISYSTNTSETTTQLAQLETSSTVKYDFAADLCLDSKIDSVVEFADKKWMFFKGDHYYEIGPFGQTIDSPRNIKLDFKEVETPIDATLDWSENILFFFKGNKYWKYQNNTFISSNRISDGFKGIPDGPFDDVFKWNINQKTYFFKEGKFWKYDSRKREVPGGYPKKISEYWKGIPDTFDAALSSLERQQTYFFKDNKYYRFDDFNKMVVKSNPSYPRETHLFLFKCRSFPIRVPKWAPLPTPPPINKWQSKATPESSTQPSISEPDDSDEGEGWLIFLTIILGLFIIVIMGTCFYASYLLFFGAPINQEENQRQSHSRETQQTNEAPVDGATGMH